MPSPLQRTSGGRTSRRTVVPQGLPIGLPLPPKQLRRGARPETQKTSMQGGKPQIKREAIAKEKIARPRGGGRSVAPGACTVPEKWGSVVRSPNQVVPQGLLHKARGTSCASLAGRRKDWMPRSIGPSTRTCPNHSIVHIILLPRGRQRSSVGIASDGCVRHAAKVAVLPTSAGLARRPSKLKPRPFLSQASCLRLTVSGYLWLPGYPGPGGG